MTNYPFLRTIYEGETEHLSYSVLEAPLSYRKTEPQVNRFLVLWDEDHDLRVIDAVLWFFFHGEIKWLSVIQENSGNLRILSQFPRPYFNKKEAQEMWSGEYFHPSGDTWSIEILENREESSGFFLGKHQPRFPSHPTPPHTPPLRDAHAYIEALRQLHDCGPRDAFSSVIHGGSK